jgi:diketogulonate reductase-like aldo/keto reductase
MKKTLTLNNNHTMPTIGLGTWRSPKGEVKAAVKYALTEAGYTHIDCASIYGNEKEIGEAFVEVFAEGKVKREDIFITSKLWNTEHHPDNVEKACRKTLADLQLEYLDLYLVHWGIAFEHKDNPEPVRDGMVVTEPVPTIETWKAMEQLVEKGLVKSIGVANFTTAMIVDLLSYAKIKPVINQIEIHPYNTQEDVVNYCHKKEIHVTAYSPLGSNGGKIERPIKDPVVIDLAAKYQKSPAQILIRWSIQRDLVVIPKSVDTNRIAENIQVFDFELSADDMKKINDLNKNFRFVDPIDWWGLPYFR